MRNLMALHRYLAERSAMPFAWGHDGNDCVSFAAGAVAAQTGVWPDFGGAAWDSAASAQRALSQAGGIEAAVSAVLPPVSPGMAQRGDVAMVAGAHGPLLMIVEGDLLAGPGATGIVRLPRHAAIKMWSAM